MFLFFQSCDFILLINDTYHDIIDLLYQVLFLNSINRLFFIGILFKTIYIHRPIYQIFCCFFPEIFSCQVSSNSSLLISKFLLFKNFRLKIRKKLTACTPINNYTKSDGLQLFFFYSYVSLFRTAFLNKMTF